MAQPTWQELLDRLARKDRHISRLESRVAQLEAQVEHLTAQNRHLAAQLQEALRAAKRQASPFSKGPPKEHPKPPGRKPGADYGPKAHRPIPDQPPDEVIDVHRLPPACR